MTDRGLARLQAASGLVFLAFLLVHLANTVAAIGGAAVYDRFQQEARAVYTAPVVEWALVLLPVVVHAVVGVVRVRRRSGASAAGLGSTPLRRRVHRWTGWFLTVVIVGHVVATRGASVFFDVVPGSAGLSFSLWWAPWMFWPYYMLLAFSGLFHGLHGAGMAVAVLRGRTPAAWRSAPLFWSCVGVGSVVLFVAIAAIGGHLGDIAPPWDNAYARLYASWGFVTLPG